MLTVVARTEVEEEEEGEEEGGDRRTRSPLPCGGSLQPVAAVAVVVVVAAAAVAAAESEIVEDRQSESDGTELSLRNETKRQEESGRAGERAKQTAAAELWVGLLDWAWAWRMGHGEGGLPARRIAQESHGCPLSPPSGSGEGVRQA